MEIGEARWSVCYPTHFATTPRRRFFDSATLRSEGWGTGLPPQEAHLFVISSTEVLMVFPELGPGQARWSADEYVGMILALFVAETFGVSVVSGEAAVGEDCIGLISTETDDDECGGLRRRIAAQVFGVGGADRFWEAIGGAEDLDGSILAVVAGGDAKMRLLMGRQGVPHLTGGAYELVPAELFPELGVMAECEVAQRAAVGERNDDGDDVGAD